MRKIFFSLVVIIAVLFLMACSGKAPASDDVKNSEDGDHEELGGDASVTADGDKAIEKKEREIPVRVAEMKKRIIARSTTVSGSVVSDLDVTVLSETSGRIVSEKLEIGKKVKKGEALVSVDSEPYRIQLDIAQANFEGAEAVLEQSKVDFERSKILHESGDLADSQFDQVKLAYQSAKSTFGVAKANLAAAKRALRLSSVRAPFAGEIASKLVKLGGALAPGTPVAQVVDSAHLKVEVGVGEDEIGALEKGHPAKVRIPTLSSEEYPAEVASVGVKPLQPTMTYPVEVIFKQAPEGMRIGMIANVDLQVGQEQNSLAVPVEILTDRFDKMYLYVIKDGKAEERLVELGLKVGRDAVITSGVEEGEQVVVYGQSNLTDGATVKVVE